MSRQRTPSSSDCRKPVTAAARISTRSTGPRTSGGGGGAGPRRPRRVGAGSRRTTSSGMAAMTASSSWTVRNCRSGLASPLRRRRGRAARVTGLVMHQPRSTARAKAPCRNVTTLRTLFGASPRRSIERAKASTSAVDTSATRRLPRAGEMCTRCIDSQFCRYDFRPPSTAMRSRSASTASSTVRPRPSVGAGPSAHLGLLQLAQRTLGHRPRQALARARCALRSEPPVAAPPVRRAPAPVVGAGLLVDLPRPVWPFHGRYRRAREKLDPRLDPSSRSVSSPRNDKSPALQGFRLVGETGFEPATARPPAGCATRLRHSPICRPSTVTERATGIEPALEAWKASVQPQHFARGGDGPMIAAAGAAVRRADGAPRSVPLPRRRVAIAAARGRTSCRARRRV